MTTLPRCSPPACSLIREFEREARIDGLDGNQFNARKKALVQELNGFIGLKKAYSASSGLRSQLLTGAVPSAGEAQEVESKLGGSALMCWRSDAESVLP
jgi:hypothetical protein